MDIHALEEFDGHSIVIEQMLGIGDDLPKEARKNSVLMEHGVLDKDKVQRILSDMEERLWARDLPKGVIKRCFNIMVEALQNSLIHSHRTESGVPFYLHVWSAGEAELRLRIINFSRKEVKEKVQARIQELNAMDADQIKQHYRERMDQGHISAKGGAGLGLITMVMRSKDGVDMRWEKLGKGYGLIVQELSVG